MVIIEKNILIS